MQEQTARSLPVTEGYLPLIILKTSAAFPPVRAPFAETTTFMHHDMQLGGGAQCNWEGSCTTQRSAGHCRSSRYSQLRNSQVHRLQFAITACGLQIVQIGRRHIHPMRLHFGLLRYTRVRNIDLDPESDPGCGCHDAVKVPMTLTLTLTPSQP